MSTPPCHASLPPTTRGSAAAVPASLRSDPLPLARLPAGLRIATLLLLAILPATVACGGNSKQPTDAGADKGSSSSDGPLAGWKFTAEDTGQSPAVALKLEKISGDDATLTLIGRGMTTLQGFAFRLAFPAKQVSVTSSEAGAAWTTSSYQMLSRFATRSDGELWGGVGHQGAHGLAANDGAELARLVLHLSGDPPIKIAFRTQRNLCIDPNMKPLKVSWLGGTFERLPSK